MNKYTSMKKPATILLLLLVGGASAMERSQDPPDWRALLRSDNEQDRERGKRAVLQERAEVVRFLIGLVNEPVREREQFFTSGTRRNTAIAVLGKLRAKESVPALIDWLVPKPGQSLVIWELGFAPASDALTEIGVPAVDTLTNVISEEGISPKGKHVQQDL